MAQMSIQAKTNFFQNRDVAQAYDCMMKDQLSLLKRIQCRMQQPSNRFYRLRGRVFYKSFVGEAWDNNSPEIKHLIKPLSKPREAPKEDQSGIITHEEGEKNWNRLMAEYDASVDDFVRAGGNVRDALEMVHALLGLLYRFGGQAKTAWNARREEREAKLIQEGVITAETGFPIPTGWNSLRNPEYLDGLGNWIAGEKGNLYYLREKLRAKTEALGIAKDQFQH